VASALVCSTTCASPLLLLTSFSSAASSTIAVIGLTPRVTSLATTVLGLPLFLLTGAICCAVSPTSFSGGKSSPTSFSSGTSRVTSLATTFLDLPLVLLTGAIRCAVSSSFSCEEVPLTSFSTGAFRVTSLATTFLFLPLFFLTEAIRFTVSPTSWSCGESPLTSFSTATLGVTSLTNTLFGLFFFVLTEAVLSGAESSSLRLDKTRVFFCLPTLFAFCNLSCFFDFNAELRKESPSTTCWSCAVRTQPLAIFNLIAVGNSWHLLFKPSSYKRTVSINPYFSSSSGNP